jgi:transcriptional regulator with XRE-family HTH domain
MDLSQERLAEIAEVSLSTVRDYEKERRGDIVVAGGLKAIREALEREGVIFLPSEDNFGPGVRAQADLPNVLRWPVKLGRFEELMIPVEWRGNQAEILVPQEVLDDLGRFQQIQPEGEYLRLFEKFRKVILAAGAVAMDQGRIGADRRVNLVQADFCDSEGRWLW